MKPARFFPLLLSLCLLASAITAQDAGPENGGELVELQWPQVAVGSVLDMYELWTGKNIIRDSNLAGVELSIVTQRPLPKDEAIRFVEASLLLNGYAFVPVDEKTAKIVNTQVRSPLSEGVPLFTNLAALPLTDIVVTYYLPLKYIDATQAVALLQQSVAANTQYGRILAVPESQSLIITEKTPLVRKIVSMLELMDVPPAQLTTRFIKLERADAERVAQSITELIERRSSTQTGQQRGQTPREQAGRGEQQAAPADASAGVGGTDLFQLAGTTQLIPDPRTNRILVISRPANFDYIRNLIAEFDTAVEVMQPYERPLKYVSAGLILPILAELISDKDSEIDQSATGQQQQRQPGQQQQQQQQQSGSRAGIGQVQATAREEAAPSSVSVGKTRLIADNRANSIIITGPPENIQRAADLLDILDQQPRQVFIATVIGQLAVDDGFELSVDIFKKFGDTVAVGQRNRSGVTSLVPDPKSLTAANLFPLASGLTIYGAIGSAIDYYVNTLKTTGRFQVLSRPSIYTSNNQPATILSGRRVAVPTSTLTTPGTGAGAGTNQTFQTNIGFEDIVLELQVTPLINSENQVTLDILQRNDNIIGTTIIDGNQIPEIGTQQLNTSITVDNRQTVVLGGLVTESLDRTTSGIPFLSDIPGLGYLFRSTRRTAGKSELVILMQPFVVNTDAELEELTDREQRVNIVADPAARYIETGEAPARFQRTPTPSSPVARPGAR